MRSHTRDGKSLLILLLIAGLLATTVGVGVGLVLGRRAGAGGTSGQEKGHEKAQTSEPGTVFSLGEMVVNLADSDSLRYAKLNVALGIQEKVAEEKLKDRAPLLRDAVINVVTDRRFTELHRQAGMRALKRDLKAALAKRLPEMTLLDVYLDTFAMQ